MEEEEEGREGEVYPPSLSGSRSLQSKVFSPSLVISLLYPSRLKSSDLWGGGRPQVEGVCEPRRELEGWSVGANGGEALPGSYQDMEGWASEWGSFLHFLNTFFFFGRTEQHAGS